jgi:hypothetical protein
MFGLVALVAITSLAVAFVAVSGFVLIAHQVISAS